MSTLEQGDREAAAVAKGPRVSLQDLQEEVVFKSFTTANMIVPQDTDPHWLASLSVVTICTVVTKDGFTFIGHSAPAAPENFNADLGQKLALDDALRQLWPMMGFRLRSKLREERDRDMGQPHRGHMAQEAS